MRFLITAGPTRERIDQVRFISNRSSGRTALSVTAAAIEAGHDVTLLAGPGVAVDAIRDGAALLCIHRFESAAQLQALLEAHWPDHDVLVMAAAVADYRPASAHAGKLERQPDGRLTLHLEPTPDLVAQMAAAKRPSQRVIAFALEEQASLAARAEQKLRSKHADAIVANPLETMDADTITPMWLAADGSRQAPGPMSKTAFGRWLVGRITHDTGGG